MHSESGSLNLIIHLVFFSNHDTFVSVLTCTGRKEKAQPSDPQTPAIPRCIICVYLFNYEKLYMFPFSIHIVCHPVSPLYWSTHFYLSCKIYKAKGNIYILNHNSGLEVVKFTTCNNWAHNRWSALKCSFLLHWSGHPLTFQLSMNVKSIVWLSWDRDCQFINPL